MCSPIGMPSESKPHGTLAAGEWVYSRRGTAPDRSAEVASIVRLTGGGCETSPCTANQLGRTTTVDVNRANVCRRYLKRYLSRGRHDVDTGIGEMRTAGAVQVSSRDTTERSNGCARIIRRAAKAD